MFPMRVYGPNGAMAAANAAPTRRAAAGGFSVDGSENARAASAAPTLRTVGGIDALLALQGLDDVTERRRRAVRRGRHALDALDALKIGLLAGEVDTTSLARLKSVTAELTEASGDNALDTVLAEIALRVEVELAKFGSPAPSSAAAR
jgi:Class II flagellar assembly regulator